MPWMTKVPLCGVGIVVVVVVVVVVVGLVVEVVGVVDGEVEVTPDRVVVTASKASGDPDASRPPGTVAPGAPTAVHPKKRNTPKVKPKDTIHWIFAHRDKARSS